MLNRSIELFNFKQWLRDKKRLMESSIYTYELVMKRFFIEVEDLDDIEKYNWFIVKYAHKKRCTHYFSVLKAYIQYRFSFNIKMQKEYEDNLLRPKKFRDLKNERQYLPDDKLIELLNNIEDVRHRTISMIQILGGSRINDVLSIQRDNIFEEEYEGKNILRIVTLGKGEKRAVIYIFDTVGIELIKEYLRGYDFEIKSLRNNYFDDYIFLIRADYNANNNLFMMKKNNYLSYWNSIKKAIEKSGVTKRKYFSTHDFRRCFARKTWEKYKDIDVLQRLLNHEDPSTTLRYLRQSGLQNIDIFKELQS